MALQSESAPGPSRGASPPSTTGLPPSRRGHRDRVELGRDGGDALPADVPAPRSQRGGRWEGRDGTTSRRTFFGHIASKEVKAVHAAASAAEGWVPTPRVQPSSALASRFASTGRNHRCLFSDRESWLGEYRDDGATSTPASRSGERWNAGRVPDERARRVSPKTHQRPRRGHGRGRRQRTAPRGDSLAPRNPIPGRVSRVFSVSLRSATGDRRGSTG